VDESSLGNLTSRKEREKRKTLRELYQRKISTLRVDGELLFAASTGGMMAYMLREQDQAEPLIVFWDESSATNLDVTRDSLFCLVEESTSTQTTPKPTPEGDDSETTAVTDKTLLMWQRSSYLNKKMQRTLAGRSKASKGAVKDLFDDDESESQSSIGSK